MKFLCGILMLLLSGCGSYARFTLPPLPGGAEDSSFLLEAEPRPVIEHGPDSDVLNPSVVRGPAGLLNFYSAFDGASWRTVLARSEDGIHWQSGETILKPNPQTWEAGYIAANGSAFFDGSQFWQWYEAGPRSALRIGLARSADGRSWTREPVPVLDRGPYMSFDERDVADPYVIREGGMFYMYYLGQDRAVPPRQRIGVARSRDGIHWTKFTGNPVLAPGNPGTFDEAYLGEPAVFRFQGFYWMLYTGTDFTGQRRLGLARSIDGISWRKLPAVFSGGSDWDSKVMCDATVLVEGEQVRVWFGGGDVVSPDERLHGQIGYGLLRPVHVTLAK